MSDIIKKFLAYDGRVSVVCANTTELVEYIRNIHELSPVATAALGRLSTISCIIASEMKNKTDKLTINMNGKGPIGRLITVSNYNAEIKACVDNPVVDLPLNEDGKLDVGGAIGQDGFINVIKDIGLKEPYVGITPIISGEVGDDFANYFVKSEGSQSAVALGVLVNKDGVISAGGYVIKPMPDATMEDIQNIEKAIFSAGAISKMLENGLSVSEIASKVTGDENIKDLNEDIIPKYKCDCNKEKFERGLIGLGKNELVKLIENDDKIETVCHFCNKKYEFSKEEINELLNNM